jgi:hypothetical protein
MDLPVATFPASLANTGTTLQIFNSKGDIVDVVTYASAKAAKSWERVGDEWYLSIDPKGGTPGAVNSLEDDQKLEVTEKELVFNEILPDPFAGGSEYIELYNRSQRTLYVSGLAIVTRKSDGTLNMRYPLSAITDSVLPGGYIVLSTSKEGVLNFYATPAPEAIYEIRIPILNNVGSSLVLLHIRNEAIIDEVSYLSKWHSSAIKYTIGGASLERIDPDAETQDPDNWLSATSFFGYGTPGYKNSQFGHPSAKVSLSSPEYLSSTQTYRLTYKTDQTDYRCRIQVFNIEGIRVGEIINNLLLGVEGEIYWDGCDLKGNRLRTGIFILLADLYHPSGKLKTFKKAFVVWP